MKDENILGKLYYEIMTSLRPKTLLFGVKLYETLDERPPKTMRPRHPMNTCQITALVGLRGTVKTAAYPTPMDIGFPQMPDYTLTDLACCLSKIYDKAEPMISEEALEDLDSNIRNVKRRGWMPGTGWNRI